MNLSSISRFVALALLGLAALASEARATILIKAKVLSSTGTSTKVQFTLSGDLSGLTTPLNLQNFLFIDISTSPAIQASLTSDNLTAFDSNSVQAGAGNAVNTMEIRNNETFYFNRLSFVFNANLTAASTISANSVLVLDIPTSSPIATEDFDGLAVNWGFSAFGTNAGRGTLAGSVSADVATAPQPAISISSNAGGQVTLVFTGVLQSSPDLTTAFTPVAGATSPYVVPAGSPSRMFFRAADQ